MMRRYDDRKYLSTLSVSLNHVTISQILSYGSLYESSVEKDFLKFSFQVVSDCKLFSIYKVVKKWKG